MKNDAFYASDRCRVLRMLSNDWIAGKVDALRITDYISQSDYSRIVAAGLADQFDEVAEIGCIIELISASKLGGDDPSNARKYAASAWGSHCSGKPNQDMFSVLTW